MALNSSNSSDLEQLALKGLRRQCVNDVRSVADSLKLGSNVLPELYKEASVYFSDIVSFTTLASESTPMEVVDFLNDLWTVFDDIINKFNVYKVRARLGLQYFFNSLRFHFRGVNCQCHSKHEVFALRVSHAGEAGYCFCQRPSVCVNVCTCVCVHTITEKLLHLSEIDVTWYES